MLKDLKWPSNFMDIGNQTFEWVYANKPTFVAFTLSEMTKPSGLFQKWQKYCLVRQQGCEEKE